MLLQASETQRYKERSWFHNFQEAFGEILFSQMTPTIFMSGRGIHFLVSCYVSYFSQEILNTIFGQRAIFW